MNKLTDKEIDELILIAYQANNHARRMVNKYEPDNKYSQEKIKDRGEWLAKHCFDKTAPKIVRS